MLLTLAPRKWVLALTERGPRTVESETTLVCNYNIGPAPQ
jgi:hypothetical protein